MGQRDESAAADHARQPKRGWIATVLVFLLALGMLAVVVLALAGTLLVQRQMEPGEPTTPQSLRGDDPGGPAVVIPQEEPGSKGVPVAPVKRVMPVTPSDEESTAAENAVPLPERKP